MKIPLYQVDAFTNKVFSGNPAAVCPLEAWLEDHTLQSISAENNLSETAFFVKKDDHYELRWFTPKIEVDLCGHATLASAFVIFNYIDQAAQSVSFKTKNSGMLQVNREGALLAMDFPDRKASPCPFPEQLIQALGEQPEEVLLARDCLVVYDSEKII